MILRLVLSLCLFVGICYGDFYVPGGQSCKLSYGVVNKKPDWVCEESNRYATYPGHNITLLLNTKPYDKTKYYLDITKNCQSYQDKLDTIGQNDHYKYEAVCKMKRKPVKLIWAQVPKNKLPLGQAHLYDQLLPCHVLEGQNLYEIECVHPRADGPPPGTKRRGPGRTNEYSGYKRNFCSMGYSYHPNLICKPTGFINRDVVVYSQDANMIFHVVIPNVPTSCACTYCQCGDGPIPGTIG
ncbi:hypothetical protein ACF0H5_007503 [Mactra antiquata]